MPTARANSHGFQVRGSPVLVITAVLVLANLSICIHGSSRLWIFQQSICLQHYLATDPSQVGLASLVEESRCKIQQVQSTLSIIEGVDVFLQLLPVGLHQPWTTAAILLTFLCDLLGGGSLVRINLCIAAIATLVPPAHLTSTNNRITSLYILGGVSASALGSALLSRHVFLLNGLGVFCSMIALAVTALLPPQLGKASAALNADDTSATESLLLDDADPQSAPTTRPVVKSRDDINIHRILWDSWRFSLHSITTLFRVPRTTFAILWIFLLYSFTTRVGVLNNQYISLTLGWSLATVNSLQAANGLLSAVILFIIPVVRKSYLEPTMKHQQIDMMLVEVSLLLNAIGVAGFGISSLPPLLIIALATYASGIGVYDSLTTVGITSLTGDQTAGDFLVRSILVTTLGGLVAAPLWSTLFSLCLKSDTLPTGLPYWISAAMFGWTIILSRSLREQVI
ncbi:MAG: hypothetical protein Q9168_004369 [Polycauliona sp. 1 TL-2023]